MSMVSVNEDVYEQEDEYYNGVLPRPSRTPSATSRGTRLRIPETIDEGHSATRRQYNLNLGMGTILIATLCCSTSMHQLQ